jgi:hemoglobin/transferrin/lactoferrin receptor protein
MLPHWTLRLGGRFDSLKYSPELDEQFSDDSQTVADVDFTAFTWQTNLTYQITKAHQVWAQAGRGFRAPTVAEMYSPTSLISRTEQATGNVVDDLWSSVANPDLKAERSLIWTWGTAIKPTVCCWAYRCLKISTAI